MPETKSESETTPCAHQPALFLTQEGISDEEPDTDTSDEGIRMMSFPIKY